MAHSLLDDMSYLQESINAVKAENSQAAIVVNMHDFVEWLIQPNENQMKFAHLAIESGADIVIGHGSHNVQDVELY